MTDTKRNISEVMIDSYPYDDDDTHDDKKAHSRPGRKPIETEPKSKRTAQNRAAQRAYRERKERKMKDLEDKVKLLEDANVRAITEADFLKAQVDVLKNELARYRGHEDFSDLKLPTKVGHLSNPVNNYDEDLSSSNISSKSSIDGNNNKHSNLTSPSNSFSFEFPWSKNNIQSLKQQQQSRQFNHPGLIQEEQVPDLVLGSSSSTSPLNDNLLVSPESSIASSSYVPNGMSTNLDFTNNNTSGFDEQVDNFCAKLGEACGTRQQPIPKYKRKSTTLNQYSSYDSPFSNLVTPISNTMDYSNDPFFLGSTTSSDFKVPNNKPRPQLTNSNTYALSFLNDNNFDVSLAFGDPSPSKQPDEDEFDPVALLTTEESIYDQTKSPNNNTNNNNNNINVNFNFNDFLKTALPEQSPSSTTGSNQNYTTSLNNVDQSSSILLPQEDESDDEVVPAPADTIECSEIWDRITAHPKYTEIDIDGLCNELKAKAKCSEKGVVINLSDVNLLLEQSAKVRR